MKSWYQLRTISNGEPEIQLEDVDINTQMGLVAGERTAEALRSRWCGAPLHGDILDGGPGVFVVSETFANVLRACGATGWTTLPVDVPGARDRGYGLLVITGRAGPIDWARSARVTREARGPRRNPVLFLKGAYFDEGTWDGSDLFVPASTLIVVVSERVAVFVEQHGLRSVVLGPMAERLSYKGPLPSPD